MVYKGYCAVYGSWGWIVWLVLIVTGVSWMTVQRQIIRQINGLNNAMYMKILGDVQDHYERDVLGFGDLYILGRFLKLVAEMRIKFPEMEKLFRLYMIFFLVFLGSICIAIGSTLGCA